MTDQTPSFAKTRRSRGPLAGPVVAAACILDREKFPRGIDDSKALPIEKREALYAKLVKCAAWGVGMASITWIFFLGDLLMTSRLLLIGALAVYDPVRSPALGTPAQIAAALRGSHSPRCPGVWPGNDKTSNARSPRSIRSPSVSRVFP